MNAFAEKTYAQAIAMLADNWGEREALVYGDSRYSFRQVKEEVDRAARKLAAAGLRRGDHLAVWLPNRPEFLFIWLGAAQMGVTAVLLNTRLTMDEVGYQLSQSDSRAVAVPGDGAFRDFLGDMATLCPVVRDGAPGPGLGGAAVPSLEHVIVLDPTNHAFSAIQPWDAVTAPDDAAIDYETDPHSPAVIAYSSGTTALPKGAMLTHAVWRKAADHGERFFQTPDDRLYLCVPLFSILSTVNGVITFWVGGSAVVLDDRFEPERMLTAIARERCTAAYLLPLMINRAVDLPDFARYDISSLRTGILVTTDPEAFKTAHDRLGMTEFITSYGMTETSSACTRTWATDPMEVRLQSHGKPLPDIEVRVADPDSNTELPPGEIGEIQVRGYNTMLGYYNKPAETARAFTADRWFKTGDAGRMTEDGSLVFLRRLSDGYKHKGFNVSCAEVEAVLEGHPGVDRAAVLGIPHRDTGEVGVAFVIPMAGAAPDAPDLIAHARRHLASFKVPAHLFLIDAFPMTAGTEKVQKFKLRERALAALGSGGLAA
ncbi:MAG: AMP-binding protein [Hyphomicrobiales bacterium]|nr:AMP-binding protein [Hyphomicrobiales bacterium]